jgi:hypothetical protein
VISAVVGGPYLKASFHDTYKTLFQFIQNLVT